MRGLGFLRILGFVERVVSLKEERISSWPPSPNPNSRTLGSEFEPFLFREVDWRVYAKPLALCGIP